ncbi:MAG: hypothetical protein Q4C06_02465 [Bacillota bacterium]|nr:hypothetical protein [Bacillota bacterium]
MRSKTPLVLMEQLIMVLVFALAAAICLQVFVYAEQVSQRNEALAEAALLAQSTAEELKESSGAVLLKWEDGEGCVYMEGNGLRIEAREAETVCALRQIDLQVMDGDDVLMEIPVAWQEVKGDG